MDKIILKNLGFYGYHGVMEAENQLGQKFFVDIELGVDLKKAGETDSVEDTVHYGMVYNLVKSVIEGPALNLIEAVAEKTIAEIFKNFDKVSSIQLELRKPEAPVQGIYDYFAVSMFRERE